MSISGSYLGGTPLEQSGPWLATIWPDSACNLVCSPQIPTGYASPGSGLACSQHRKAMSYHPRGSGPLPLLMSWVELQS